MPRLAQFKPHAVVLTEHPTCVWMAAVIGAECLRIELKGNAHTWLRQSLAAIKHVHPFWKPTGVVVNMRRDFAVEADLQGNVRAVHDQARGPTVAYLTLAALRRPPTALH